MTTQFSETSRFALCNIGKHNRVQRRESVKSRDGEEKNACWLADDGHITQKPSTNITHTQHTHSTHTAHTHTHNIQHTQLTQHTNTHTAHKSPAQT